MILHAGLIAMRIAGQWRGLLIQGPSGAGKSDLALRALDHGFRLVADDRVLVFVSAGKLFGRAPDPLAGLLEVRGQGIVHCEYVRCAPLDLAVRCVATPMVVERFPGPMVERLLGVALPVVEVWPFEPAAPNKLCVAMEHLGRRRQEEYQARFASPKERAGA